MALATAWCNGRDQGQARVGIFGFFFRLYLGCAKIFLLEYCGQYFQKGGDGGTEKIMGAKIT